MEFCRNCGEEIELDDGWHPWCSEDCEQEEAEALYEYGDEEDWDPLEEEEGFGWDDDNDGLDQGVMNMGVMNVKYKWRRLLDGLKDLLAEHTGWAVA